MKKCIRCNKIKASTYFYKTSKGGSYGECKICMNTRNIARVMNIKKQLVDYKGGKCEYCGYSKNLKALEFHHLDPTIKDFTVSQKRNLSFDSLKEEVNKCILLCSNCHREEHDKLWIEQAPINFSLYQSLINSYDLLYFGLQSKQKISNCLDCGIEVTKKSIRCNSCAHKKQEKIDWPSKEELNSLLESMPRTKIAKLLGVSDNAIKKRALKLGIYSGSGSSRKSI